MMLTPQPNGGSFFCPRLDNRLISKLLYISLSLVGVTAQANPAYQAEYMNKLEEYVQQATRSNPGLQRERFELEAEQAFLDSLYAQYKPALSLQARISFSEGGRTIDFPAGDLLNPVYNALNDQSQAQGRGRPFPTIENQSIPLLREAEQDTRLIARGPLINDTLDNKVQAQSQNVFATEAKKALYRQTLQRDVQRAYWQLAQASNQVLVLQTSLKTLTENERVNNALYKAGQVTLDAPRRAEAEKLNLMVTLERAQLGERLALEYFNLLRNQPANAKVEVPAASALEQMLPVAIDSLAPVANTVNRSKALEQVDYSVGALQSLTRAEQSSYRPELAYQVEGGYQGESYSFGPNRGFATASVVLNWQLWDAGTRKSQVAQAQAKVNAAQAQREELVRQLKLAQNRARQNLEISLNAIRANQAAAKASAESFRISQSKRDAGEISQVEFLDQEQLNTRNQIALTNAICQAHIDHAEWQLNNHLLPDANLAKTGGTQ